VSQLDRAVEIMDRLRSPGGCPWDAEQTHRSLARYLLEEAYEVLEAIETDDLALLREELGDLLLQVLFHARIAQELPPGQAFGIDDVAGDLADKLVSRHPHVFAGAATGDADELNEAWEQRKIAEKGRTSVADGVPVNQPALALAAKLVSRARRAGLADVAPAGSGPQDEIGLRLFAVVQDAVAAGVDAESALRGVARSYRQALVAAESATAGSLPDATG
jgi:XTP/dITP diphosphohydrolase